MPDFSKMTVTDAIKYCHEHKKEYIRDGCSQRDFECLITIIERGTISPQELPDYGMDY